MDPGDTGTFAPGRRLVVAPREGDIEGSRGRGIRIFEARDEAREELGIPARG